MAIDVKIEIVTGTLNTSTGVQRFDLPTGFGVPKAMMAFVSGATADDTVMAGAYLAMGMQSGFAASGAFSRSMAVNAADDSATSDVWRIANNSDLLYVYDGAVELRADIETMATDYFEIDIISAPAAAYKITWLVFGGDDITDHGIGHNNRFNNVLNESARVRVDYLDFKPDLIFVMSMHRRFNGYSSAGFTFGVGVLNDAGTAYDQHSINFYSRNSQSTTSAHALVSDTYGGYNLNETSAGADFTFEPLADGVDIQSGTAIPSDTQFMVLGFQFAAGVELNVDTHDFGTSGNVAHTAPGFEPIFGMVAAAQGPTIRNTAQPTNSQQFAAGIALFNSTDMVAISYTDEDALSSVSNAKSLHSDQFRFLSVDGAADAWLGSTPVFDADGWDSTATTNPLTNPMMGFALAIGEASAGGGPSMSNAAYSNVTATGVRMSVDISGIA